LTTDDDSDKRVCVFQPTHGMLHQYPYCKGRPGAKRCFDHP
jgi:hypothetical protein